MLLVIALHAVARAGDRPVVVELFTSQGCNSCPPAEAYLGDLATRPDVLALEFHVDYWDYIGWDDPFAAPAYTERQKAYQHALHSRYVYTPQMVIDGETHVVGSDRTQVEQHLRMAAKGHAADPVVTLTLSQPEPASLSVSLAGDAPAEPLDVFLVTYDHSRETAVKRGENRGKVLVNHQVVRALKTLGQWQGGDWSRTVPVERPGPAGGHAVIVQRPHHGPVVQAARIDWGN